MIMLFFLFTQQTESVLNDWSMIISNEGIQTTEYKTKNSFEKIKLKSSNFNIQVHSDCYSYSGYYDSKPSITATYTCYNATDCFFDQVSSPENSIGGAVSVNNVDATLTVSACTFYSCKQLAGNGGAIYFAGDSCTFSSICGYKCHANNDGQIIYTNAKSSLSATSITGAACESSDLTQSSSVLALQTHTSTLSMRSTNISYNTVSDSISTAKLTGYTISNTIYNTFTYNEGPSVIGIFPISGTATISSSVFRGNTLEDGSTIFCQFINTVQFTSCYFLEYLGNFSVQTSSSSTVTISNSYLTTTPSGSRLVTSGLTITDSFSTPTYSYLNTAYCLLDRTATPTNMIIVINYTECPNCTCPAAADYAALQKLKKIWMIVAVIFIVLFILLLLFLLVWFIIIPCAKKQSQKKKDAKKAEEEKKKEEEKDEEEAEEEMDEEEEMHEISSSSSSSKKSKSHKSTKSKASAASQPPPQQETVEEDNVDTEPTKDPESGKTNSSSDNDKKQTDVEESTAPPETPPSSARVSRSSRSRRPTTSSAMPSGSDMPSSSATGSGRRRRVKVRRPVKHDDAN